MQDSALDQAMKEWEKYSDDPRVREAYYDRRKAILDEKAAIREAELRLKEAIEKGTAEGRAQGIAEGRIQGMAEGKAEGRVEAKAETKAEIARRMLIKGIDLATIAEVTGLSENEISELK